MNLSLVFDPRRTGSCNHVAGLGSGIHLDIIEHIPPRCFTFIIMTTRICFILQGQTDIPLNETGRSQALAMAFNAAHHDFIAIYSSDLSRAYETAQMVAARRGLDVNQMPQLRERHFGIFQGVTADEGKQRYPGAYAHYKARDPDYDFETGESLLQFSERITVAVDSLTRHHGGQTIAAVCHAGVLDIVYRKSTGRPLHTPRDFVIPNCALNWFRFDGQGGKTGGWHLEAWDDHHHLAKVLMESPE
jgi:probable phosphoglycerate mutase